MWSTRSAQAKETGSFKSTKIGRKAHTEVIAGVSIKRSSGQARDIGIFSGKSYNSDLRIALFLCLTRLNLFTVEKSTGRGRDHSRATVLPLRHPIAPQGNLLQVQRRTRIIISGHYVHSEPED